MSTVLRRNRKGSDREILRFNALGFSLKTIGVRLDCHPTSVIQRLQTLDVPTADTRRAFMEDVLSSLPGSYVDIVADILEARDPANPMPIKDYVRQLLIQDVAARQAQMAPPPNPSQEEPALNV